MSLIDQQKLEKVKQIVKERGIDPVCIHDLKTGDGFTYRLKMPLPLTLFEAINDEIKLSERDFSDEDHDDVEYVFI